MEIPKVNKKYIHFDDGKLWRKYDVVIKEVIKFEDIDDETINLCNKEKKEYGWLYAPKTDYFIKADLYISNNEIEPIIYVKTKQNEWFSLGFWAGLLDEDENKNEQ